MYVGVLEVEIRLPTSQSLKDKRRIVQSILAKTRAKFQIAGAEVGLLTLRQGAVLGFACVSNSKSLSEEIISDMMRWIETDWEVEIVEYSKEIY